MSSPIFGEVWTRSDQLRRVSDDIKVVGDSPTWWTGETWRRLSHGLRSIRDDSHKNSQFHRCFSQTTFSFVTVLISQQVFHSSQFIADFFESTAEPNTPLDIEDDLSYPIHFLSP